MVPVLLATCDALPVGDDDATLLQAELAERGIAARWLVWTDPYARWDEALVVLRSTWDYTPRRSEFLSWVDSVPRLANAAELVRWNTDKIYLDDLARSGLPIVPTSFAAPGEPLELDGLAEFVVKPSVGAGSRGVGRFLSAERVEAEQHARQLHDAGRTVMIQPYLDAVDVAGETALVYFDGRFSHAIGKAALLPPGTRHAVEHPELYVAETIQPRTPSEEELEVGDSVLGFLRERFGADPLYARVDLLPSAEGPRLVELELTEPSLFLDMASDGGAVGRFAAAIAART